MSFRNEYFSGFGKDSINYKAQLILFALEKKYGKPSCGRNRACFYSKDRVIKFPLNNHGFGDNDWEGSVSGEEYAKGRCVLIDGFICLVQERLKPWQDCGIKYKDLPDWTGFIDCAQVGYDNKGNLKAYDFGRN